MEIFVCCYLPSALGINTTAATTPTEAFSVLARTLNKHHDFAFHISNFSSLIYSHTPVPECSFPRKQQQKRRKEERKYWARREKVGKEKSSESILFILSAGSLETLFRQMKNSFFLCCRSSFLFLFDSAKCRAKIHSRLMWKTIKICSPYLIFFTSQTLFRLSFVRLSVFFFSLCDAISSNLSFRVWRFRSYNTNSTQFPFWFLSVHILAKLILFEFPLRHTPSCKSSKRMKILGFRWENAWFSYITLCWWL